MTRSLLGRLRRVGPLTVAAALGIGALPALAQSAPMTSDCSGIRFDLANPSAGAMIEPGGLVIQGVASDTRAQDGLGVDKVDFFLDSREQGGVSLGTAMPGAAPAPFGGASFETTLSIPTVTGGHDLFAYAHSTVSGAESVISVPVAIGEDPIKAGEAGAMASTTCLTGNPGMSSTTAATTSSATPGSNSASAPLTATTTVTTPEATAGSATLTLTVYNPSPGDTIHAGGYVVEGVAFDKAAQTGSGVDRIDIFLDSRDSGGMMLAEATPGQNNTWHVAVPLPSNQTGLHTLSFYAHSTVSDQQAVTSIPVTIAP